MKILVTGANGQLGTVLTQSLQQKYGKENVIASDIRLPKKYDGIFEIIDVTDAERLEEVLRKYNIKQVYHLAAVLSANGEKAPLNTWGINMKTLLNVLSTSQNNDIDKVFFPSSIAVFGEGSQQINTPNNECLNPATAYGISKAVGENWCNYYFMKYGLDVRSIRYPGIIGYQSLPGGGTTDYAVEIYHKAVKKESFTCYLNRDAVLPMIFMDDVVRATLELMEAPKENIKIRTSYNLAGASFSPEEMALEIRKIFPDFQIDYNPDYRQSIANTWPKSIDDSKARDDWNWKPEYDLSNITEVMIEKIQEQYSISQNC